MKKHILSLIAGLALVCGMGAETLNSPELNQRVWALLNVTYGVDVDMDGSQDLFFYGDLDALVSPSVQAYGYQLRLVTSENVYVSTLPVPAGPEEPVTYMFTTFLEGTLLNESLTNSFYEWTSGDLPFLGFDIAGGIPGLDSYLAVKIQKESDVFYGWVRLIFPGTYDYFDETGYVKIKESSYQSTPTSPIVAGVGKTEKVNSYSNSIETSGTASFEIELKGVENMQCMLLESTDLSEWDTVLVKYSSQSNLKETVAMTSTSKFYRWQVTENLETID